ncbi:hypothetical protein SAMN05192554_11251 [Haloarchaeobius iranensis]|uniref:Uncharacterized protein n=1 Tax=Haloarchaeobius iranensis TaxID=996166 RepID=A0A1G9XZQ4_9EURY|nr:hypothetical protein SAMN05192554_11251 [Haloarchaeobius iranensis]
MAFVLQLREPTRARCGSIGARNFRSDPCSESTGSAWNLPSPITLWVRDLVFTHSIVGSIYCSVFFTLRMKTLKLLECGVFANAPTAGFMDDPS